MGDWYEIKELLMVHYIEYQNAQSGWNPAIVKLTDEQVERYSEFMEQQQIDRDKFLKSMTEELERAG